MTPVSEFLPTLRMLVDVPVPGLMETAIVKAAIRFCRESKVVIKRRTLEEVNHCQSISIIGNQFGSKGKPQLKGAGVVNVTSNGAELQSGKDYNVQGLGKVCFNADFTNVEILSIVEPVNNATQLPDILFDDYLDGVCAGAASILQMQPNVNWQQPDLAQFNEREFVSAYRKAYRYAIERTPALEERRPEMKREFY